MKANNTKIVFLTACLLAGASSLAASAFAQGKRDFSGEWLLNRQASTLSPGADGVQSGVVQIEHRTTSGSSIDARRTAITSRRPPPFSNTLQRRPDIGAILPDRP
jgi:hypothetical protein